VEAMLCEVVIDLDIELLAIRIRVVSNQRFVIKSRIADSAGQQPLVDSHVETIAVSIEKIVRIRHCPQRLGEISTTVKCSRPLRVPYRPGVWIHRKSRVGIAVAVRTAGTIRWRERASVCLQSTKHAETDQTAGVRRAIRPDGGPERPAGEIDRSD